MAEGGRAFAETGDDYQSWGSGFRVTSPNSLRIMAARTPSPRGKNHGGQGGRGFGGRGGRGHGGGVLSRGFGGRVLSQVFIPNEPQTSARDQSPEGPPSEATDQSGSATPSQTQPSPTLSKTTTLASTEETSPSAEPTPHSGRKRRKDSVSPPQAQPLPLNDDEATSSEEEDWAGKTTTDLSLFRAENPVLEPDIDSYALKAHRHQRPQPEELLSPVSGPKAPSSPTPPHQSSPVPPTMKAPSQDPQPPYKQPSTLEGTSSGTTSESVELVKLRDEFDRLQNAPLRAHQLSLQLEETLASAKEMTEEVRERCVGQLREDSPALVRHLIERLHDQYHTYTLDLGNIFEQERKALQGQLSLAHQQSFRQDHLLSLLLQRLHANPSSDSPSLPAGWDLPKMEAVAERDRFRHEAQLLRTRAETAERVLAEISQKWEDSEKARAALAIRETMEDVKTEEEKAYERQDQDPGSVSALREELRKHHLSNLTSHSFKETIHLYYKSLVEAHGMMAATAQALGVAAPQPPPAFPPGLRSGNLNLVHEMDLHRVPACGCPSTLHRLLQDTAPKLPRIPHLDI